MNKIHLYILALSVQIAITGVGCRIIFSCVHHVRCWVEGTRDMGCIGSLRQKVAFEEGYPTASQDRGRRTTNLTRAAVLPTSNKSTSNHINPLPQTWSSTTLSPPSARSALTTYVKLSDNRPFRRDHEEDSGRAHGAAHFMAME